MNKETVLRLLGNSLLIIGYCVILYSDFKTGLTLKFFGGLMIMPSLIQLKMWDGILITSFFSFIEGTRIIQLYFLK